MENAKDRPKKRRGCLKIVLIFLLLFGVVRAGLFLYAWSAVREFRTKGWPLTAEEYNAWYRAVPEEQNAGPLYMKAFGILSWQAPNASGRVDKPEDVVEILLTAADLPGCRFSGTMRDIKSYWFSGTNNKVEIACGALEAEAIRSAERGDAARAAECVRATCVLGRAISQEPSFFAQSRRQFSAESAYCAFAFVCSRCDPPENVLAKLDAEIALLQESDRLARTYQASGALLLSEFSQPHQIGDEIARAIGRYPAIAVIGEAFSFLPWEEILYSAASWSGLLDVDKASALRWALRMEGISELPLNKRDAAIASLDKDFANWPGGMHSVVVFRDMRPFLDSENVCQTRLVIARTAVAIERYKQKNGALPKRLADLVPAFLAAEPVNPLSGAPLNYAPSAGPTKAYTLDFWRDPASADGTGIRPSALDRESYSVGKEMAGNR